MATLLDEEILREAEEEEDFEYYSLLNVGRGATQEEIRSAYRRLCRVYHPDRSAGLRGSSERQTPGKGALTFISMPFQRRAGLPGGGRVHTYL